MEIENLKINSQKEMNELKEKLFEENKNELHLRESERLTFSKEHETKFEEITNKFDSLMKEKIALEDSRIRLEANERDLIGKNSILSSELKVYKEEVENLRTNNSNLNQFNFAQEKSVTELSLKYELILKQLEEKEKNVQNLNALVDNLTKQKSDADDTLKSLKNTNNKLDDKLQQSIGEINKGNEIIRKLQVISFFYFLG